MVFKNSCQTDNLCTIQWSYVTILFNYDDYLFAHRYIELLGSIRYSDKISEVFSHLVTLFHPLKKL